MKKSDYILKSSIALLTHHLGIATIAPTKKPLCHSHKLKLILISFARNPPRVALLLLFEALSSNRTASHLRINNLCLKRRMPLL